MDAESAGCRLAKVVPGETERLLDASEIIVEKVRIKMILRHRLVLVCQLMEKKRRPEFFPADISLFLKQVLGNEETLETAIGPQHMQFAAKVVNYFVQNPADMVTVTLVAAQNKDTLYFLAYSIVPSFFGFFSSMEHLRIAFPFYCLLITKAPKSLCATLLLPFFSNACLYRYIEAVTSDVISFFCQDARLRLGASAPRLLNEHANTFLGSIMKHLNLVPSTHLSILTMLHRNQWTSDAVFQFFLNDVVVPLVSEHLSRSPFGCHLGLFAVMVNMVSTTITAGDIDPLFTSHSIFEVPPAFGDFMTEGLLFVTTAYDVALFMNVAKDAITLPKVLILLQEPHYITSREYDPVALRVYRRTPEPMSYWDMWRKVLFPDVHVCRDLPDIPHFERRYRILKIMCQSTMMNTVQLFDQRHTSQELEVVRTFEGVDTEECEGMTFREYAVRTQLDDLSERALAFERLLIQRFALDRLDTWTDLIEMRLRITLTGFAETSLVNYLRQTPIYAVARRHLTPEQLLQSISPVLNQEHMRIMFYAMRAEVIMFAFLEDPEKSAEFDELEMKWTKVVESAGPGMLPPQIRSQPKSGSMVQKILALVDSLTSVQIIPFYKAFSRILAALKTLSVLSQSCDTGTALVDYVVSLCNAPLFISTVLKISAILIKDPLFVADLSRDDVLIWYEFECAIARRLRIDDEAAACYDHLNEELLILL